MYRVLICLTIFAAMGMDTQAEAASNSEFNVYGTELVTSGMSVVPCQASCVSYRYHRLGSHCKFDRCDMHPSIVLVKDPCTCCCIEVPVCVPCCCTAVCSVDCRHGLFGKTIYEYCWDCGFRMEVAVHKNGDMIVHYYGVR